MTERNDIIVFLIVTTVIILFLVALIVMMLYFYQKRQMTYNQKMTTLKLNHEKNLMSAQLEIQENTFQNVSREIHDNISLTLTLAKLNLNTIDLEVEEKSTLQLDYSVDLLTRAIKDLSDISKSLNSENIGSQGLIRALENEIARIETTNLFRINFNITGEPIYLDTKKDVIIFRIIQEAFNNIIKHADANYICLTLHFSEKDLDITIADNGRGFELAAAGPKKNNQHGSGLKNMEARTKLMGGTMKIRSELNTGTSLVFNIPF
jgi:two-component system, NarL family, sensor kinase